MPQLVSTTPRPGQFFNWIACSSAGRRRPSSIISSATTASPRPFRSERTRGGAGAEPDGPTRPLRTVPVPTENQYARPDELALSGRKVVAGRAC